MCVFVCVRESLCMWACISFLFVTCIWTNGSSLTSYRSWQKTWGNTLCFVAPGSLSWVKVTGTLCHKLSPPSLPLFLWFLYIHQVHFYLSPFPCFMCTFLHLSEPCLISTHHISASTFHSIWTDASSEDVWITPSSLLYIPSYEGFWCAFAWRSCEHISSACLHVFTVLVEMCTVVHIGLPPHFHLLSGAWPFSVVSHYARITNTIKPSVTFHNIPHSTPEPACSCINSTVVSLLLYHYYIRIDKSTGLHLHCT